MQNNEFYEIAKSYADKIRQVKNYYFLDNENSFCVILTDTQELYTGISSVKITDIGVEIVPAEFNAIMSMIYDSKAKALQMAVIAMTDYKVRIPSEECLDFLTRIEPSNTECELLVAPDKSITIEDFKTAFSPMSSDIFKITPDSDGPAADQSLPGEAESAPALGSPADFAAGFEFDAANPFYTDDTIGSTDAPPPVQAISSKPTNPYADLRAQQPMGGFQQPYQQQPMGGFRQQYQQPMGGFQQQYQQQPMGGFQQQYQQPMGGFQQPYQQPMGGFQQPMNGYPQQPIADPYAQPSGQYQAPPNVNMDGSESSVMMKQRLSNLLNGGVPDQAAKPTPAEPTMSREELLKRSKEMKKAAKLNEKMRKQF